MVAKGIQVDGLDQLNRAIRVAEDVGLPKRMGAANKSIGELIIARLQPRPDEANTGAGAGATVRPSASKREVLLRVGGRHREGSSAEKVRVQKWGKLRTTGRARKNGRPNIKGTADEHFDEISRAYLDAIRDAMAPAFHDVE